MSKLINRALFSTLIISSFSVTASPLYTTSVLGQGYNDNDGMILTGTESFQNTLGSASNSSLTNETYEDVRLYGYEDSTDEVLTTVTYSGQAQASSAGLKSKVSGQQFSESVNSTSIVPKTGLAQFSVDAYAGLKDTLSVTGASDLSSVEFDITVHGTRSNAPFGSFIQVSGSGVNFGSNDSIWDGTDDFDLTLTSGSLDITDGTVDISLTLLTSLSFFLGGEGFDNEYDGIFREVDFFNTVTINQFKGFDTLGNQVDLSSVTGSGGQAYETVRISQVPVPAAFWLFGVTFASFIGMRKVRKLTASS